MHFSRLEHVTLEHPVTLSRQEYRVEGFKMHHGGGIMKLSGIDSPELAKTFNRFEIFVPLEFASPLKPGEWYEKDLKGMKLIDMQGKEFGVILSIISSSDDLLEIRQPDGKTFFIPFREQFVEEPNLKERSVILKTPWLVEGG